MIVPSTGASTTWFSVFLEALFAATFGGRLLFAMELRPTPLSRRTFSLTFFAVARLAADLCLTLALAFSRFEPFLRVAALALAIAFSSRVLIKTVSRPAITALSDSPHRGSAISSAHRALRWRVPSNVRTRAGHCPKIFSRVRPAAPICLTCRAADSARDACHQLLFLICAPVAYPK
jgi:hypothetical protein